MYILFCSGSPGRLARYFSLASYVHLRRQLILCYVSRTFGGVLVSHSLALIQQLCILSVQAVVSRTFGGVLVSHSLALIQQLL